MAYEAETTLIQAISEESTTEVLIPRGRRGQTITSPGSDMLGVDQMQEKDEGNSRFEHCEIMPDAPSLHTIKQKSNVSVWEGVRAALRAAAVECSGLPIGQKCILCSSLAEYRCVECAPWAFYCPECFGNIHSKIGIFHTGEIWQVQYCVTICI